jgi:hypothetical protein
MAARTKGLIANERNAQIFRQRVADLELAPKAELDHLAFLNRRRAF